MQNIGQMSVKDQLYVKEQLSKEQLCKKKCSFYVNQVQDQQLKSNIEHLMSCCDKRIQNLSQYTAGSN